MTTENEIAAIARELRELVPTGALYEAKRALADRLDALGQQEPVAWAVPGDDNARPDGSLDAMAWKDGEFTRPLYATPATSLAKPIDAREQEAREHLMCVVADHPGTPFEPYALPRERADLATHLESVRTALDCYRAAVLSTPPTPPPPPPLEEEAIVVNSAMVQRAMDSFGDLALQHGVRVDGQVGKVRALLRDTLTATLPPSSADATGGTND